MGHCLSCEYFTCLERYQYTRPRRARGPYARNILQFTYHTLCERQVSHGFYSLGLFDQAAGWQCVECGHMTTNDLGMKFLNNHIELRIPLCDRHQIRGVLPYQGYLPTSFQFEELRSIPIVNDILRIFQLYQDKYNTRAQIELFTHD
jgi:hypothetical protein